MPREYDACLYSTIGNTIKIKSIFLDARVVKKGSKISVDQYELDVNYCTEFLKTL
jgi:hypothetical protein